MSDKTFGMTEADIQKAESRASKLNDGNVPKGSEAAMMQVSWMTGHQAVSQSMDKY